MKSYLLATFLLMSWANSIAESPLKGESPCAASNVAFIMDLSQTTSGHHDLEKDLVQKLVDQFPEKSRYGLVVFGKNAILKANFQPELSAKLFKQMVKNLDPEDVDPQQSYLDKAINLTAEVYFPLAKERQRNILFILTDGLWTNAPNNPEEVLRKKMLEIFSQSVRVVVLAIGPRKKTEVLKGLVPLGQDENIIYFMSTSKSKVDKYLDTASRRGCGGPAVHKCEAKVDLGFIIDRSGSIKKSNFDTSVKPFIINVTRRFNISKDGVHAGVEVFSNPPDTKVVIGIGSETNTDDFVKAVNEKVVYHPTDKAAGSHFTYTNVALKRANEKFFNYVPREGVKRYALLVTDGKQYTIPKYPEANKINSEEEARKLWKEKKVSILAIGAAEKRKLNETALKRLAKIGDGKYIWVENVKKLNEAIDDIIDSVCKVCKLKLVVVLDASMSTRKVFDAERYILLQAGRMMNVTEGGSQCSVITFSVKGKLNMPFDKYGQQTSTRFEIGVQNLTFLNSRTKIENGLRYVNDAMEIGPDKDLKKAVLVITDGRQNYNKLDKIREESKKIREKGYPIKTISIFRKKDAERRERQDPIKPLRTLKEITGNDKDNYFLGKAPNNLSEKDFRDRVDVLVRKVLRSFCKASKK